MPSEFNIAKSKLSISDFPFTYGVSCKPTAQQQHRQVNIGQNKVSLESYPFARTLTGNTYRWREDNVYYHYCGNINIPNM